MVRKIFIMLIFLSFFINQNPLQAQQIDNLSGKESAPLSATLLTKQAGRLDSTFGNNGIVTTSLNRLSSSFIWDMAVQSDGKIITAGNTSDRNGQYSYIARYNINGSPDMEFGTNGIVITKIGRDCNVHTVAVQNDGKIVAAGYTYHGNNSIMALFRYNTDGSLDKTFAMSGIDTFSIGSYDNVNAIAIQENEKIVVAGRSEEDGSRNFVTLRLNSDGSMDNAYGTNGINSISIEPKDNSATSVTIQGDGKIVAAGYTYNNNNNNFAIVRYNTDGSLDQTFGTKGIVKDSVKAGNDDSFARVIVQNDGKIVAAGTTSLNDQDYTFVLARYNADGSRDKTFGTNGIVLTSIGEVNIAFALALQSDGKIVEAGSEGSNNINKFAVTRYNSNGNPDSTFGTNGIVTTSIGPSIDMAHALLIQNDGKIAAAGNTFRKNSYSCALVRYNSNGHPDDSFGTNGIVTTVIKSSLSYAYSEIMQNDGKIIAAGYSNNNTDYDFAAVRYNTNGAVDTTFGTSGMVTAPVEESDDFAYSAAIQDNGKIVCAGYAVNLNKYDDFALVRWNADGTIDSTFGGDGKVTTSLGTTANDIIHSIAIQSDGKILAAGSSDYGGYDDFALARYNSDGSLDHTFGTNGIVTTTIAPASFDEAYSVKLQQDGKIIVAGNSNNGFYYDFTLMRYNEDGSLDNTFGTNGQITNHIGAEHDFTGSIDIMDDGKIILAGSSNNGSNYIFTLLRYNNDGSIDSSFGNNGVTVTPVGDSDNGANSIAVQNDGKIVTAGYVDNGDDNDFALARYNSNGITDSSFGLNGIMTTSLGISYDIAHALLIQKDKKIVAAGSSSYGTDYSVFTLIRYYGDTSLRVTIKKPTEKPSTFVLAQNYPNPFNPSTTIRYTVPFSEKVTINIYNILGEKIKSLVRADKLPGSYLVSWNGTDSYGLKVSSGIYFYTIKAGPFIKTRKMVFIQ